MAIHLIDVIQHKRDGLALTYDEIHGFVRALVERGSPNDTPTDAQTSALLMAILIRGLDARELAALTQAMRYSGETLDTASLGAFVVDKQIHDILPQPSWRMQRFEMVALEIAAPMGAASRSICRL